jgi:hypothetical protein
MIVIKILQTGKNKFLFFLIDKISHRNKQFFFIKYKATDKLFFLFLESTSTINTVKFFVTHFFLQRK